jgi:acylphosphatase
MRAHLVVRGQVQGVGFRWFVQQAARALDLAGAVRNAPDGSVEVEVEGDGDAVERLRAMLMEGPPAARVESVETIAATPEQLDHPFRIRR